MENEKLKGKWNQIKGALKQRYASLTDNDLQYSEGKYEEFLGNLQEKTGESKEKLKDIIDSL